MKTIGSDTIQTSTIHAFEAAGLGKAPFVFTGLQVMVGPIRKVVNGVEVQIGAPGQPMGCCQFCSTGIKDAYWLRSADGKDFYVGCDCIRKAGDAGLLKVVKIEEKKKRLAAADRKRERERVKFQENREELRKIITENPGAFSGKNHPMNFTGLTLLDYLKFMVERAGKYGMQNALKMAKEIVQS